MASDAAKYLVSGIMGGLVVCCFDLASQSATNPRVLDLDKLTVKQLAITDSKGIEKGSFRTDKFDAATLTLKSGDSKITLDALPDHPSVSVDCNDKFVRLSTDTDTAHIGMGFKTETFEAPETTKMPRLGLALSRDNCFMLIQDKDVAATISASPVKSMVALSDARRIWASMSCENGQPELTLAATKEHPRWSQP